MTRAAVPPMAALNWAAVVTVIGAALPPPVTPPVKPMPSTVAHPIGVPCGGGVVHDTEPSGTGPAPPAPDSSAARASAQLSRRPASAAPPLPAAPPVDPPVPAAPPVPCTPPVLFEVPPVPVVPPVPATEPPVAAPTLPPSALAPPVPSG